MTRRQPANNNGYRAVAPLPLPPAPLLTIERAIADGLSPTSLRQVAGRNTNKGPRRERAAANLMHIANRLELLGYGREREREAA